MFLMKNIFIVCVILSLIIRYKLRIILVYVDFIKNNLNKIMFISFLKPFSCEKTD